MSFPQQTSRAFTKESIEGLNPNQLGCYGLFRAGVWVYIGKGDIRARLLAHFNGDNACITGQNPTHYVTLVTANMDAMEKALILECNPVCNRKVG